MHDPLLLTLFFLFLFGLLALLNDLRLGRLGSCNHFRSDHFLFNADDRHQHLIRLSNNTDALSRYYVNDTNRSTSQISSSSASSAGVRFPTRLRQSNSCARAAAGSDGWKSMISLAAGRRAKNEITSRRKLELCVQVRRSPRAMISATRSRSGSNCRANCSGISMVTCMIRRLRHNTHKVKLRILAPGTIRHSSFVIRH